MVILNIDNSLMIYSFPDIFTVETSEVKPGKETVGNFRGQNNSAHK